MSSSDDDVDINIFKSWLLENGSNFAKVDWPSSKTTSGIRGAVALDTIETDEFMIEIPAKLMISPPNAFDSDIGEYLLKSKDILYDSDLVVVVFLMHELSKGKNSFYYPYINILPKPATVADWTDEELKTLQVKIICFYYDCSLIFITLGYATN